MGIDNKGLDFREVGGVQNPSYKSIERVSARSGILCEMKNLSRDDFVKFVLSMQEEPKKEDKEEI